MARIMESKQAWTSPVRVSYLFMGGALVLMGWLHLATPVLAALFAYLALTKLHFSKRRGKWLPIILFLVLLLAVWVTTS